MEEETNNKENKEEIKQGEDNADKQIEKSSQENSSKENNGKQEKIQENQSEIIKKTSSNIEKPPQITRPSSHQISRKKLQAVNAFKKPQPSKNLLEDPFEIKQAFQQSLSKLSQNQTRDRGLVEIKELITNNSNQNYLRFYLSILFLAKSDIPAEKEAHLLIISHLAITYKENLIDPIDKPPDIRKTLLKIIEYIHNFFLDNRGIIYKLCARVLVDLLQNNTQNIDWKTKVLLFFGPLLENIKTKTEINLINCSALCLCELTRALDYQMNKEIFDCLQKEIPTLIKKKGANSIEVIKFFKCFLEIEGNIAILEQKTSIYLEKFLPLINKKNKSITNPFKIEICSCMEKIALLLKELPNEFENIHNLDLIIETIYENSKDIDPFLRAASSKTLETWLSLIGYFKKDLQKYTNLCNIANSSTPQKKNSAWRDLKNIRALFKISKLENEKIPLKIEKNVTSQLPKLNNFQNANENLMISNDLNDKSPKEFEQKQKKTKENSNIVEKREIKNRENSALPSENEKPKSFIRKKEKKVTIEKIVKKKSLENIVEKSPNFLQQNKNIITNNNHNIAEADNLSQIKASQFQKKKTGIGGGHIPFANRNVEKKLSLLKEMIRKSVEKRPQSADPSLKQRENLVKINEDYQESLKMKTMPPIKTKSRNFENDINVKHGNITNTNDNFFSNNLEEIPTQKEENIINEHFYEKPQRNNFIRPPQNFEVPVLKEITQKLEKELAILPQNNRIDFQNENYDINNEQPMENSPKTKLNPWKEALILLQCQDVEQAYESLLDNEDDIYLLRLMIKTGPCFKKLGEKMSVKLINRILDLFNSNFIEKTCLDFFLEAKEEKLFNSLSLEDQSYLSNFF